MNNDSKCTKNQENCNYKSNSGKMELLIEMNIKFPCPFYSDGCLTKLSYSEFFTFTDHINNCPYRKIKCIQCQSILFFKDINTHIFICDFCNETFLKENQKEHYDQCENYIYDCNICGTSIIRKDSNFHTIKLCKIQSERKNNQEYQYLALLFKKKMYCEDCTNILPCLNGKDNNIDRSLLKKFLPNEINFINYERFNKVSNENELKNFRNCFSCNRILCAKEFPKENPNSCKKCRETSKCFCGLETISKNKFYCELHKKYQCASHLRECKSCKNELLVCCGFYCIKCSSPYCKSCADKNEHKFTFCKRTNLCVDCVKPCSECRLKFSPLDIKFLESKDGYFCNLCADKFNPKEETVKMSEKKKGIFKSNTFINDNKFSKTMEIIDDSPFKIDFIEKSNDNSDSFNDNLKRTKGCDEKLIKSLSNDDENLVKGPLSMANCKLPKQICKYCKRLNFYFNVSCKYCGKYL